MSKSKGTIKLTVSEIADIYSKFDDRPHSERDLSGNFINELMSRAEEEGEFGKIEIKVKKKTKKTELETAKKRVSDYFSKREEKFWREQWINRFKGTAFVVLGGVLLTAQTKVYAGNKDLAGLLVLPAGWLSLFLGAEYIFADWRIHPGHKAARKLKAANYSFSN
ncbi:MAG: hypothetical protein V1909_03435 [Candidatus Micrarchaeota archaeon]